MKIILITGVAGNIGSSLAKYLLLNKKSVVVGIDNFCSGFKENLPTNSGNFIFYKGNVNNINFLKKIFINHKINEIYHYAAYVGVDRTIKNPELVFEDIKGIHNILRLSKEYNVKKIAYASSSEVYGENSKIPYHEIKSAANPKLPYASVKLISENMIISLCKKYQISYVIFRFFNTYGPLQSNDYVIKRFINLALKNKPLEIYGDGTQTRTFLYIDDNVEATTNAFSKKDLNNQIINIGSKKMYSINQLAKKIIKITGSKSKIIHREKRLMGDTKIRQPDNKLFLSLVGKRKLVDLDSGIQKVIDFIQ